MYPHVFELFAITKASFVDDRSREENLCCRGPKLI